MQPQTESLFKYPYICIKDYKSRALKLENINSTDLILNSKSSLKCKINNDVMVVPSNTIILLDQGNSFSYEGNDFSQVKVLRFNSNLFAPSLIFTCGFINTQVRNDVENFTLLFFKNDESASIGMTFNTIENLIKDNKAVNIKKLKKTICNLLESSLKEKFANDAKDINSFGKILNSQFSICHNVSDYALKLEIKPKNLLRLFQRNGLKNPGEIIKRKLILESKEMIAYSDKNINEVCFEIGFSDPAYFSRFFKKNVGITAREFRKKYSSIIT